MSSLSVPIIAGFYSDPSICRLGEDYYLVNSSFEYFPGVPIWHSQDLVSWTQLGNVLERPSQLTLRPLRTWLSGVPFETGGRQVRGGIGSDGVYAPTIRHHGNRFWMTTTVVNEFRDGPLVVWSDSPAGPWSDPVHVRGLAGIDSDLAWDEDGTCFMALSSYADGAARVQYASIDPATGELLSAPRDLWQGTGGVAPEGPHLYRRNGWWYVLLAEGGTGAGHAVTMARSRTLDGEWEPHPDNPMLTHRGTAHPVQNTGHADLIESPSGEWAMVFLGVRQRSGFHVNGRETFLVGIDWDADWPVIDDSRFTVPKPQHGFIDDFALPLHPRWISSDGEFATCLTLREQVTHLAQKIGGAGPFIGARTRDDYWTTVLTVDVAEGAAGLRLRMDDDRFAEVRAADGRITTEFRLGDLLQVLEHAPVQESGVVELVIRTVPAQGVIIHLGPDVVELGIRRGGEIDILARVDGRHLSSEVAGGFTGRVVGVKHIGGDVGLHAFEYRVDDDEPRRTHLSLAGTGG